MLCSRLDHKTIIWGDGVTIFHRIIFGINNTYMRGKETPDLKFHPFSLSCNSPSYIILTIEQGALSNESTRGRRGPWSY